MKTARFIGPYRIIAPVGVGASSTVYRAVRPETKHQVAIKLLADNHSVLTESRRRFSEEWAILGQIRHRAVATIYEVGETESGQPYMVLELANRGDLRTRVDELVDDGYQISRSDICRVAQHLHEALTELHRRRIVHRDVSPSNILLRVDEPQQRPPLALTKSLIGPDERILLTDLGFAKRLEEASGLTRGGGTEGFAAPEQRRRLSQVDQRADIYSATAIVAWLAEGTPSADTLASWVAEGTSPEPDTRPSTIDDWYNGFRRALARDPGDQTRAAIGSKAFSTNLLAVGGAAVALVGLGVLTLLTWLTWFRPQMVDDATATATPSASNEAERLSAAPESTVSDPNTTPLAAMAASTSTPPTTSSTTSSSPTPSSTAGPSSTAASSTTGTATTAETTTSATVDPYPFSPRAFISGPTDGATVDGDLEVAGTGRAIEGLDSVELVVKHLDTNRYWHPDRARFDPEFIRFTIAVDPAGGSEVTWAFTLAAEALPPGGIRLRAWARGSDGTGDPLSDIVTITVP